MSEQEFESGSKDRATVALVYREVSNLSKITEAHFEAIKIQLRSLDGVPARVELLDRELAVLRRRVGAIEQRETQEQEADEKRRSYRVGTLPLVLTGIGMFVLGLINILGLHV